MTNVIEHLSLLSRMKKDGLLMEFTGRYEEEILQRACEDIETIDQGERLRASQSMRIQKELIENPLFGELYATLCDCEVSDNNIEQMLETADAHQECLTQYPQEQVLEAAMLNIHSARLNYEYMKYYLPSVMYEEEEKVIVENLRHFPIYDWESLSTLTERQRAMLKLPYLGAYILDARPYQRNALDMLDDNQPLKEILGICFQQGIELVLDEIGLKDLQWLKTTDVDKFCRMMENLEHDIEDISIFVSLWLKNHAVQYDLNWFASQPQALAKEQREEIFYSRLSYLSTLYSGRLTIEFDQIPSYQIPVLIYAVEHHKKHFLDVVSANNEAFLSLGRYALLFDSRFYERCNLNSLTVKHISACDTTKRSDSYFDLLEEGERYTFEEMQTLWHSKANYVRLYAKLMPLPVDKRLVAIRQLLKRDLLSQNMEEEQLEQLARCLLSQPFSIWYECDFSHIRGLTRRTAIQMLQQYEALKKYIPKFQSEADAVFAVSNASMITPYHTWQQVREAIMETDQHWEKMKEEWALTGEFENQNHSHIIDFLLQGGSALVWPLYQYLQDMDNQYCEALRRIVMAELMGQFYRLKYFADDLNRELRYSISEGKKKRWEENRSLNRNGFSAEEVDDFYHTIQIGELPRWTCLSYKTGSQRDCLMAAFDSNKKIVLIKRGETIVGRACLRLTKGAFQQPEKLDFQFADLTQEEKTQTNNGPRESLVLFLERIYTSGLNNAEEHAAKRLAVELVTQKAAELGAVAVLALQYAGCYDENSYVSTPFYVYISKSKNGQQYLDSLGGAAVTSEKERYVKGTFMVERNALRSAGEEIGKKEEK